MSTPPGPPELPDEPPVKPSRAGVKRARRARRRRRRVGFVLMIIGIGIAAAGVTVYLDGRNDADVEPIEQSTTTELPPTASAPSTVTSEPSTTTSTSPTTTAAADTTVPEPTVP